MSARTLSDARILIVDNEPANVRLLEQVLQRAGFANLVSTTDSREVAALCEHEDPDLVLLDLHMPHRDGFGVLRDLAPRRADGGYLPVLVLTADPNPETKQRALAVGATDFLIKPLDSVEVVLRIRNLLETRFLYLELRERNRDLQGQLYQSQKLEAVGRLAGGIAHDFNNLLTAITGHSQLLLLDLDPASELCENVTEIRAAADRAAALTHQLLAFSRKQVLHPVVLELEETVVGMNVMLRRLIGEDIELVQHAEAELGRVRVDPGQLTQVILNLVVNARDAMPRGGRIEIDMSNTELAEADARRDPDALRPGPYVQLTVADTGSGRDLATRERIFEPFFTTKALGSGTGLGLSTVYGIINQSGGRIRVESEPGRGSRFRILLPRTDAPAAVAAGGDETILLVEDEPAVRMLTHKLLERSGYTVLEAASGVEALRVAELNYAEIDLLLTDVVMPGMSGRELADRLVGTCPELRVLFMTGYTDDAAIRHGIDRATMRVLQKPFNATELDQRVRDALESPPPSRPVPARNAAAG